MQGAALGMLLMVLTSGSSRQFSQFGSCAATFQFNKLNGIRFCTLFFSSIVTFSSKSVGAKHLVRATDSTVRTASLMSQLKKSGLLYYGDLDIFLRTMKF